MCGKYTIKKAQNKISSRKTALRIHLVAFIGQNRQMEKANYSIKKLSRLDKTHSILSKNESLVEQLVNIYTHAHL